MQIKELIKRLTANRSNLWENNTKREYQHTNLQGESNLLTSLESGIWTYHVKENKIICSEGIISITGYSYEEFQTFQVKWEDLIYHEDKEKYLLKQEDLLHGKVIHHKYRITCGDKSQKWVEDYTIPMIDEKGNLIRLDGIVIEIANEKINDHKFENYSYVDSLTQLGNRKKLEKTISEKIEQDFTLLLIKIKKIKNINQAFGKNYGDSVIVEATKRLQELNVENEKLFRYEGNQFALLLSDTRNSNDLVKIADRIISHLKKPYEIDEQTFFCNVYISICNSTDSGNQPEEMLKSAEVALSEINESEHVQIKFASKSLNENAHRKFQLEFDLSHAINRNEFILMYQPKIDGISHEIIGAEALIRWEHPKWGIISPNEFIPMAEKSDLINIISDWVLETVCKTISIWRDKGIKIVPISINISPRRLLQPDYATYVENVIKENRILPNEIEIEITESSLMVNEEVVKCCMEHLAHLGIQFSLDDFGTGYSSIHYLKEFKNIHTIKIDRSFISKVDNDHQIRTIVKSFILLAKGLKMKVIAEGVEKIEQLKFLIVNECTTIQGFLFSKPLQTNEIEKLIRRKKIRPSILKDYDLNIDYERRKDYRIIFQNEQTGWVTIKQIRNKQIQVGKTEMKIKNISAGGLCFESKINVPVRDDLIFESGFDILEKSFVLKGKIVWSEKSYQDFRYGITFIISEMERADLMRELNKLLLKLRADKEYSYI